MVDDAVQQMADSLKNIERYLAMQGDLGGGGGGGNDAFAGSDGVASRSGTLDPGSYVIKETDDLDGVTEGGTVTLQPGDTKTIVEARAHGDGLAVLAVGATDTPDVTYRLQVDDDRVIGGETNAPLGVLNEPFSFVESFGAIVPVKKYIEYEATYSGTASGEIELAGRLHVEQL